MEEAEIEVTEVPGRGWIAHATQLRAIVQGATEEEALANFAELVRTYPRTLEEARRAPRRRVEVFARSADRLAECLAGQARAWRPGHLGDDVVLFRPRWSSHLRVGGPRR